jgi:hypothetical protein
VISLWARRRIRLLTVVTARTPLPSCRLDERLELDYQIGEDLKDRIIPHSILYFTGEATAYEMDDEDFDDEFDDEEVCQKRDESEQ